MFNIDYLMVGLRHGCYPRVTDVISYHSQVDKTIYYTPM